MTTLLLDRVRRHVARRQLWPRNGRVVAALSGGADSVAQLFLLRDLAALGELVLVGAAHLNHQLRPEAEGDERFCRDLCERLSVPLIVEAAPVAAFAAASRVSIEVAARRARYAFLERARAVLAGDVTAVAHTADDQAETVLLRLLRGAGTRGLRGILPAKGRIVRPLLECARADLRRDLGRRGEVWVEDATNRDLALPRNRVRHELLPLLAQHYQPAVTRVLARTAEVARVEDSLLERLAADAASTVLTARADGFGLSRPALAALPLALARRVVRRALELAGPERAPDLADVEAVLAVCQAGGPPAAEVAGLRVERFSEEVVLLIRRPVAGPPPGLAVRALSVPGMVLLPELGPRCRLAAERPIKTEGKPEASRRRLTLKGTVATPLVVRGRQPGDRIRPPGVGGTRKLQDLLVDRKVRRAERDRVPVVADATGRIVWVVGHAADADAVAAAGDDDVIVLTFDQPDVPGSEGS